MNKQDLVRGMAEKAETTQKEARALLDAYIETVKEGLIEDGRVQLTGLHTMEVVDTPERNGHNPHTNKPMVIPAGRRVRVRVSEVLKDLIS